MSIERILGVSRRHNLSWFLKVILEGIQRRQCERDGEKDSSCFTKHGKVRGTACPKVCGVINIKEKYVENADDPRPSKIF